MHVDEQIGNKVTLLLEGNYPNFMTNINLAASR